MMRIQSLLLILVALLNVKPTESLFAWLFGGGCSQPGGCFFWLFGTTMHRMNGGGCEEKCVFFKFLAPDFSCGGCPTTRFACPANSGDAEVSFMLSQPTKITLEKSSSGNLCTLTLVNVDGVAIPVARQYGYGWERAGGRFAGLQGAWDCSAGDSCATELPDSTETYVLTTRTSTTVDAQAERARFLESASFGATPSDLTDSTPFADYVSSQLSLPATFHREFFRRHANPLWKFHAPEFAAQLDPCKSETSWRRQLFTVKDKGKMMRVDDLGSGHWQISIDNIVRSVFPYKPQFTERTRDTDVFESGKSYRLECFDDEELRRGILELKNQEGKCRQIDTGNFTIGFPPTGTYTLTSGVQAPTILSETLPQLDATSTWKSLSSNVPEFLLKTQLSAPACSVPLEYSRTGPGMFVKTVANEWLQFDPRVILDGNTVDAPIPDGGASKLSEKKVLLCSNVARNPFNENGCFVATDAAACSAGPIESLSISTGNLVCGSEGEVANDPGLGDKWLDLTSIDSTRAAQLGVPKDSTPQRVFEKQREFIWSEIALSSNDQVRQRVAWALFQIFALPKSSLSQEEFSTEMFLSYYDIFVRHAFGNYLDILREITYNPLMAESLSYVDSRSTVSLFGRAGDIIFPDENFARELMQLFTIGLVELNPDGTPELLNGETIRTYDSDDILSFARAWTGFRNQAKRSNIEDPSKNQIDPMYIRADYRDIHPKSNLYGGYIGDGYPLCHDLPDKAYLQTGAKFLLLGSSPIASKTFDDEELAGAMQFPLSQGSGLYKKLCGASSGSCAYPGVVTLDAEVSCPECASIDKVRVLKVADMFYEYISTPCVDQPFYAGGMKINRRSTWNRPMCARKESILAGVACCDPLDRKKVATRMCEFGAERTTYETAQARCSSIGQLPCDYRSFNSVNNETCPYDNLYRWTNVTCENLEVKVSSDGRGAVVYDDFGTVQTDNSYRNNTIGFFPLFWNGDFPKASNGCSGGSCEEFEGACLCKVSVEDEAVFDAPPTSASLISQQLTVGHVDPKLYEGVFSMNNGNGYKYYCKKFLCFDHHTVFEVRDDHTGRTLYLRNLKSTVRVKDSGFSFRNPVQFHHLYPNELSIAKAEAETEAVLEHFFLHKNTPPFVSTRLIQRFGISNPSPPYVLRVATAFRTGAYSSGGKTFGSGKYGDMGAAVAAVLLDREARSLKLDNDPSYGSLREPILKVLAFMRGMEFKSSVPLVQLDLMDEKIGQAPYEQSSVFNFFRPEYSPPGDATVSMLMAPEAEVMGAGKIVGFLNGIFGLVKHGLLSCEEGFGYFGNKCETSPSSGALTYSSITTDRSQIVRELTTILTSGRMSDSKQNTIIQAINRETDDNLAFQLAVQLIVTSPEFHATNTLNQQASAPTTGSSQNPGRPEDGYKAVIHLTLLGGLDSFNMLVPNTGCGIRDQYNSVRGEIRMQDANLLPLDGPVTGQPACSQFSVHEGLSVLRDLYNDGDALFVANMGVLTEPVTKSNYKFKTLTQLFAHNAMQEELHELDPRNLAVGTGTLGRMSDALEADGFRTGKVAVEATPSNLAGSGSSSTPLLQLDEDGVSPFDSPTSATEVIEMLNSGGGSGVFGNLWSDILTTSLTSSEDLLNVLASNPPAAAFNTGTKLGRRAQLIAQMIAARKARGVDRDHFYFSYNGFDSHFGVAESLNDKFLDLNETLTDLVAELKLQNVWDDVVIVETSDFGRTLTPNSGGGSDHGWGGNYFVLGGGVKGKRILGEYPTDLSEEGPLNVGRGRMIPTLPWESLFHGIAEWMGVTDLGRVLPNHAKFNNLFSKSDLFN